MANYHIDFIGLNTLLYEVNGWDPSLQFDAILDSSDTTFDVGQETKQQTDLPDDPADLFVYQNQIGRLPSPAATNAQKETWLTRECKNFLFPLRLPDTASYFPALMLRRNGPYNWPTWKQTRTAQNPLTRKQNQNSVFTYVEAPGEQITIGTGSVTERHTPRFGAIRKAYEPAIVSKYHPLQWNFGRRTPEGVMQLFSLGTVLGNECNLFSNDELHYGLNAEPLKENDNYSTIKSYYLDDNLNSDGTPVDGFEFLKYRETVYPREVNAYRKLARGRQTFKNKFWRSGRLNRNIVFDSTNYVDGFANELGYNSTVSQNKSMWALDPPSSWTDTSIYLAFEGIAHMGWERSFFNNAGIHWQTYAQGAISLTLDNAANTPDEQLHPAAYYARRHTSTGYRSTTNPVGMFIVTNQLSTWSWAEDAQNGPSGTDRMISPYFGATLWSAGVLAGYHSVLKNSFQRVKKEPFYDSYDSFAQGIRQKAKDYTIVPEFRMSTHVENFLTLGYKNFDENENLFELTGAIIGITSSNVDDFYKTYSTTDFLKHFEILKTDHMNFIDPSAITLKCKAIKKFLPYEGFYPVERTTQMSQQFYKSYQNHITMTEWSGKSAGATFGWEDKLALIRAQNLMTPLFAPGVMFNSIKSGVACDWPALTQSMNTNTNERAVVLDLADLGTSGLSIAASQGSSAFSVLAGNCFHYQGQTAGVTANFYGNPPPSNKDDQATKIDFPATLTSDTHAFFNEFDIRIPFEALVEPEKYMSDIDFHCMEPHPSGNTKTASRWNGDGDSLYKRMAHNFLAETADFFLKDQSFTSISSLSQDNANFGNVDLKGDETRSYAMRVKMFRPVRGGKSPSDEVGHLKKLLDDDWALSSESIPTNLLPVTGTVTVPQDLSQSADITGYKNDREAFTMYSRPSAFGPPTYGWVAPRPDTSTWYVPFLMSDDPCDTSNGSYSGCADDVWDLNCSYWVPDSHGFPVISSAGGDITSRLLDVKNGHIWNVGPGHKGDSRGGYNFPFTPPYYYGQAWADIVFTAKENKKYTLPEIIASSSVTYWRVEEGSWITDTLGSTYAQVTALGYPHGPQSPISNRINKNAMQLSASLNLFSVAEEKSVDLDTAISSARIQTIVNVESEKKLKWVIQTKYETPILNFNTYKDTPYQRTPAIPEGKNALLSLNDVFPLESDDIGKPKLRSMPIGMWHQYGRLPTSDDEGVFVQITNLPEDWNNTVLRNRLLSHKTGSLAELVGFSTEAAKLGVVSESKMVHEAVVAAPFVVIDGVRKFFRIPRADLEAAKPDSLALNQRGGTTITKMIEKMKRYVFPPSMDFLNDQNIDPFAMYIFEFKHEFSRRDLADIWQNLPPKVGMTFEEAESTISHELLAHELMGGGAQFKSDGQRNNDAKGRGTLEGIRWMVFKVKQKAKTNYFSKIIEKQGTFPKVSTEENPSVLGDTSQGVLVDSKITYNWPYDFFSLVELIKIDAEVEFSSVEENDQGIRKTVVFTESPKQIEFKLKNE